jgi:hypothetical protein
LQPIKSLDESDEAQSQGQVIARLTDGQLSLFGDHSFQSRKRYPGTKPTPMATDGGVEEEYDE